MRQRLYATRRLPIDAGEVVGPEVLVASFEGERAPTGEEIAEGARGSLALLTQVSDRIDASLLDRLPTLRVVAQMAVGFDNVDVAACRARGIVVTHTPDALTDSTAELAFGLILAVARRFHEGEALVRHGSWRGFSPTLLLGRELAGRTLGIVGYGRIGRALGVRARAFGMRVIAATRRDQPFSPDGVASHVPLARLLAESDVVSLHCPATQSTRHLIGDAELSMMQPGAILVNTARGTVVDEGALVRALERRHLAGAGLDVFEREPTVHAGLLSRSDVVLLPHLGSATLEARARMAVCALEDACRVMRGERPQHLVPE
ncbi:MAG: D-glycerate dehydrogenase [Deltaproteobacteria bacterium]|nr:D-glycerate dehydrogenase [Deltaproteobacteria bacterium]